MGVIREERKAQAPIPDDIYTAEVSTVEEKGGVFVNPETGISKPWTAIRFKFKILDSDPVVLNRQIYGFVYAAGKTPDNNIVINPGTPLDKWLGVLGANLGNDFSLDSLKGRQCTIVVSTKGKYANVTDIKHIKVPVASVPVSAPAPVPVQAQAPVVAPPVQAQVKTPSPVAPAPVVSAPTPSPTTAPKGRKINF